MEAHVVVKAAVNVKLAASYAEEARALAESPVEQSLALKQPLAIVVDMAACAVAAYEAEEPASYTVGGGGREVAIAVPLRNGVEEAYSTAADGHMSRTGD